MDLSVALTGLLTGLALIVAIGAQNAYVLRLGLSAPFWTVFAVVAFCTLSDAVLIFAGVGGITFLTHLAPWVMVVLRLAAIAFLVVYGALSAMRALRTSESMQAAAGTTPRLLPALATVAAFTWLNPHVYLDTVLFLGSFANQFGAAKWSFALGAAVGSLVWFAALGFGARALRPLFARAWTWRVLDGLIAVIMFGLAAMLIGELVVGA